MNNRNLKKRAIEETEFNDPYLNSETYIIEQLTMQYNKINSSSENSNLTNLTGEALKITIPISETLTTVNDTSDSSFKPDLNYTRPSIIEIAPEMNEKAQSFALSAVMLTKVNLSKKMSMTDFMKLNYENRIAYLTKTTDKSVLIEKLQQFIPLHAGESANQKALDIGTKAMIIGTALYELNQEKLFTEAVDKMCIPHEPKNKHIISHITNLSKRVQDKINALKQQEKQLENKLLAPMLIVFI